MDFRQLITVVAGLSVHSPDIALKIEGIVNAEA
jgi:hypothetical protein